VIQEAIKQIEALAKQANALPQSLMLKADDGSGRMWRWDPKTKNYVPLERWPGRSGNVSNIQSLVLLAGDEAVLRSKTGKMEDAPAMRITMTAGGAEFVPDVVDGREKFTYRRKLSPQWEALKQIVGAGAQPHKAFVRALQRLRPSVTGYADLARAFRSISLEGSTRVLSEPVLKRGAMGNAYEVRVQVRGGETEAELPTEIPLSMAIAKGSPATYGLVAEVDIEWDEEEKSLSFQLVVPDMEEVLRNVEDDEAEWLRTALKSTGLGGVVVLQNYA
jgi:hypothetical protein